MMDRETFIGLLAEGSSERYQVSLTRLKASDLSPNDVLVEVAYSSLNYKDALAVTGRGKIIRRFPMVCGIDLAGRVLKSNSSEFSVGDQVLAVGQGLGETHWGGFSQQAAIPADALLHVPPNLTVFQSMAIGTAGFTAMLCLMTLEQHGAKPTCEVVLITGASGGVGSIAISLLAAHGYNVTASTGRAELSQYLARLGARKIVPRSELQLKSPTLGPGRWSYAIDVVGGNTLTSIVSSLLPYGAVAVCGLAGGPDFMASVYPFILRNVSILGVNSTITPKTARQKAWHRLASELPLPLINSLCQTQPLSKVKQLASDILAGRVCGRIVVDVNA